MAAPIQAQVAETFYNRLFEIAPSVRPMFKGDIKAQGLKLTQTLGMVVAGLHNFGLIEPTVAELGRKHVGYGVEDKDYDTVAQALLWTLEKHLGPAFTPQVKEAWTQAYTTIAGVMTRA
jgi:nitric oxide dioxygenase